MMSTLLYASVAIIAITKAAFEDCGTTTLTVNGNDYSLQIQRKAAEEMVRITVTGPSDQYTGVIIGQSAMTGGYAVIGSERDSTYEGYELLLAKGATAPGEELMASGDFTATTSDTMTQVILDRPYMVNGTGEDDSYFDLTDLMTCAVTSIDIAIATADGTGLVMGYHGENKLAGTFTSTCTCDDEMTSSTEEPADDDIVICGEAELIDDVLLTVYRDSANEMVRIQVQGPPSYWWGYGFGETTNGMTGAYAVTVQGADEANLGVSQYVLDSAAAPGVSKDYGTTSITITDTVAVGTVTMAYDAADFDFTDFLTCKVDSIDLIAAKGTVTAISAHDLAIPAETLTRLATCTCEEESAANSIFNGFIVLAAFMAYLLN